MTHQLARFFTTILIMVALVGCASTYKEPSSGPVATIVFDKEINKGAYFRLGVGDDDCAKMSDWIDTSKADKEVTLKVAAEQEIFLTVGRSASNYYCNVNFFFTPETNKKYAIVFSGSDTACKAGIAEKIADGYSSIKVKSADPASGFRGAFSPTAKFTVCKR